ncbi:hypothetical protein CDIK_3113 [Cucumispora dikerogammari]|nr:hypothetical protein CDIK_3113 [Cucumispora dikerogammari]
MFSTETNLILILNGIYFYLISRLLHSRAIAICSYIFIMTGNVCIMKPYKILNGSVGDIKVFLVFVFGLILIFNGFFTFGILIQTGSVFYLIKNKFELKGVIKGIPMWFFKWSGMLFG